MDLFDMLGINVEVAAEKPKESKKSEKPKKAVPKEKQITYTKGEINTGFCVWHYDFSVSVALAKVQEEFLQEYPGDFVLDGENLLLAYSSQKEEDMTYVLDKDVRVVYGPYQMQLEEEKTVKDALADFGAKFPEFDSCVGVYNKDAKVLYPRIIATEQEPDPRFPVRMGFGLDLIEIKEVPEKADYMSYMKKQYEKAYQVSLDGKAPFHFCQATNTWIPCFAKKRNNVEKKPSETVYQLDGKSILTPYGYMSDQVYSGHYHAVMLANKSEEVYRSCYRDAGRPSCYTVQFPELPVKRSEYPTERKRLKKLLAGCGIDLVLNEKEEVLLWRELFVTGPFRMMNDASMEEAVYAVRSHGMHIIEKAMERSEYLRGEYIEIRQQEIARIKNTCKVL